MTPREYKIIIRELRTSRQYNKLQRRLYGKETPTERLSRVKEDFLSYLERYIN